MLLETVFCTVFFVLPLVGMFALVIRAALRKEASDQLEMRKKHQWMGRKKLDLSRFKKRRQTYSSQMVGNKKILYYQLVECKRHHPLQFDRLKRKAHPRAGP